MCDSTFCTHQLNPPVRKDTVCSGCYLANDAVLSNVQRVQSLANFVSFGLVYCRSIRSMEEKKKAKTTTGWLTGR